MLHGADSKKVIVLGLDGASWDFLDIMISAGSMPNLKTLISRGTRGILESSFPPITPSAWPSITTGVNPGKHGIFDFVKTNYENGEQTLTTTRDLEHPRIYEMLAMQRIETMVFNPIPAYPIVPLKNLKVASIAFSPKPVYHPDHMKKYALTFPDYLELFDAGGKTVDKDLFLDLKLERTYQRVSIVEEALRNVSWSLAWIRLQDPDDLLHTVGDIAYSSGKVHKMFAIIDRLFDVSHDLADLVVLVSDHGFRRYTRTISLNTLLYKEGLAIPESKHGLQDQYWAWNQSKYSQEREGGFRPPRVLQKFLQAHEMRLLTKLGNFALKISNRPYQFPKVDPIGSRAYSPTPYGDAVFVREASDLERTRQALTGREGIAEVKTREDVYWGPYVTRSPNLLVMVDHVNGYRHGSNRIERHIWEEKIAWDHHPYGVALLSGERVQPKASVLITSWDMTPTLMSYLGVPLPHDADGTILKDLLDTSPVDRHDYSSNWNLAKVL